MNARSVACLCAVLVAGICPRSADAQPIAAAWIGTSRTDPQDYRLIDNWIDLETGQIPMLPPNANSAVFFDSRAGQAPLDPTGNIGVAIRDDLAARQLAIDNLQFRFFDGGQLQVGALAPGGQGIVTVREQGRLFLDEVTLSVRDSMYIGGGPTGPTGPASFVIDDGGILRVGDTLHLWNTAASFFQMVGGEVRAKIINTDSNPQQFQWFRGQLSFEEFLGDLNNLSGTLSPGTAFGIAAIAGSYAQQSGGTTAIEIGGTVLGESYDHVKVAGTLGAAGTLLVSLEDNFAPAAGDEFHVLEFDALTGEFDEVLLPTLSPELEWDPSDLYSAGLLRVRSAVPVESVLWTGAAGDGNYFNPENWDAGLVPTNTENQSFAVTLPPGADLDVLPNQFVQVTRLFQTATSQISIAQSAEFEVVEEAVISGDTTALGPGAGFFASGPDVRLVGAPRLAAREGGQLVVAAETYEITVDRGTSTLILADGRGSSLELPSLRALSVGVATGSTFRVLAANSGELDLSELETIMGVAGGSGHLVLRAESAGTLRLGSPDVSARTSLEVDGPNSLIDVQDSLTLASLSRLHLTDGGTLAAATLTNRGTISGHGTIRGNVINHGIISPGSSTGEIEVDGDLEATASSIFDIEISGLSPVSQYDKVMSSNKMTIGGQLHVSLIDGGMGVFEPGMGDEFQLFTAMGGLSGKFSSVHLPQTPVPLGWQLLYEPSAVSLLVTSRLPGDFDADGDVDRDDLLIWQQGVGTLIGASQTDGDGDGDRDVDGNDLLDFLLNFGTTAAALTAPAGQAVPEPAGLLLIVILLAFDGARRIIRSEVVCSTRR